MELKALTKIQSTLLAKIHPKLLPTFASILTVVTGFCIDAICIAISAKYMVHCLVLHSRWQSYAAYRTASGLSTVKARLRNTREPFTELLPLTCHDGSATFAISFRVDVACILDWMLLTGLVNAGSENIYIVLSRLLWSLVCSLVVLCFFVCLQFIG